MKKKAIIFGITGQDGSYLAEFLIQKGYKVIGVKRRSSTITTTRLNKVLKNSNFNLIHGDITDTVSVFNIISSFKPNEVYNLAAQSHVGVSFNEPEYTAQVDAIGTLRLLEAIRIHAKDSKFYQASTSELYGGLYGKALNEDSEFNPRSPYAAAKLYSYYIVKQYREGYGLNAYNGILFNHESPRRGENFVTRKITIGLSELLSGKEKFIELGNLNSKRDWGHAKDYVEAMHAMLSIKPGDYVVSTGNTYSIREFLKECFKNLAVEIAFEGKGINEIVKVVKIKSSKFDTSNLKIGQIVVKVNTKFFRPLEVPHLLGDSTKFRQLSKWKPKYNFELLAKEMIENDAKAFLK